MEKVRYRTRCDPRLMADKSQCSGSADRRLAAGQEGK